MNPLLITGLVLGLAGGLHCAGMCGPLVLAFGSRQPQWQLHVLYHAGRVTAYIVLGQLLALVGAGLQLVGLQRGLSVVAGGLMIVLLLIHVNALPQPRLFGWIGARVREGFVRFSGQGGWRIPVLGFLNGLLPCGLVYTAAAASLAAGSWLGSGAFMALFGLGTLPVLLGLGLLPNWRQLRPAMAKANPYLPYLGLALAALLIVRGVGLPTAAQPAVTAQVQGEETFRCPMCQD